MKNLFSNLFPSTPSQSLHRSRTRQTHKDSRLTFIVELEAVRRDGEVAGQPQGEDVGRAGDWGRNLEAREPVGKGGECSDISGQKSATTQKKKRVPGTASEHLR